MATASHCGAWPYYEMSEIVKRLTKCDSQDFKWYEVPEFGHFVEFLRFVIVYPGYFCRLAGALSLLLDSEQQKIL